MAKISKSKLPAAALPGWAAALSSCVSHLEARGSGAIKTLDELTTDEQARAALTRAAGMLSEAASSLPAWTKVVSSRLFGRPAPPDVQLPNILLNIKRNFETPIGQKIEKYYKALSSHPAVVASAEHKEGVEVEYAAYQQLQLASSLLRVDPSETNRALVKGAAEVLHFHESDAFTYGGLDLPEELDQHPLWWADHLAAALRSEYQQRVSAKRMLIEARQLLEMASSLLEAHAQLKLSAANDILGFEVDSIFTLTADEQPRPKKQAGRKPTNEARYRVIAELVKVAPPGSPAEIAEIMSTRYPLPMTADQVSTDLKNIEHADKKRPDYKRLLGAPRTRQKPGRRRPVK